VAVVLLETVVVAIPTQFPGLQTVDPLSWDSPAIVEPQIISPSVTFVEASRTTPDTMPTGVYVVVEVKTPIALFDGVPVQFPIVAVAVTQARWPDVPVPEPSAKPVAGAVPEPPPKTGIFAVRSADEASAVELEP
jgi:hypothetical protein